MNRRDFMKGLAAVPIGAAIPTSILGSTGKVDILEFRLIDLGNNLHDDGMQALSHFFMHVEGSDPPRVVNIRDIEIET